MKKNFFIFTLKNFIRMALLIFFVSLLAFLLIEASPIDPLQENIGEVALGSMSEEQIAKVESYWGVNEPALSKFSNWAKDFYTGDMGESLLYRRSVSSVIWEKLSNSLILLSCAWIISGIVGFVLGIVAGIFRGRIWDKIIKGYCLFIASTPTFWLALVLLMIFSVWLKILPVGLSIPIGMTAADVTIGDRVLHAVLPALTLSITGIANIALHTREKTIEIFESDYVLFARARGESTNSIVKNHICRNVILPAITLQFASISEIFGGSVLVEQIFSYPGLGQAAVTAGLGSDVPLLLGITVISAVIVFGGNFIANILYAVVDPRIRRGGKQS